MSTVKVGDKVLRAQVPSGTLFAFEHWLGRSYEMRQDNLHFIIGYLLPDAAFSRDDPGGDWQAEATYQEGLVSIVALNVPADATADDLRVLAERFEVREALLKFADDRVGWSYSALRVIQRDFNWKLKEWVERLHRAGWRSGMTAEDAARMLAEVQS